MRNYHLFTLDTPPASSEPTDFSLFFTTSTRVVFLIPSFSGSLPMLFCERRLLPRPYFFLFIGSNAKIPGYRQAPCAGMLGYSMSSLPHLPSWPGSMGGRTPRLFSSSLPLFCLQVCSFSPGWLAVCRLFFLVYSVFWSSRSVGKGRLVFLASLNTTPLLLSWLGSSPGWSLLALSLWPSCRDRVVNPPTKNYILTASVFLSLLIFVSAISPPPDSSLGP